MIMRALDSLFSRQNAEGIKMHVSFVEVYNNQAFDLLSDSPSVAFYTKNGNILFVVQNKFFLFDCVSKLHLFV